MYTDLKTAVMPGAVGRHAWLSGTARPGALRGLGWQGG